MKNKLTAVEWLESKFLIANGKLTFTEFKQAKQKEKEKQKYFFDCGRQYQLTGEGTFKEVWDETYGGNNEK